MDSKSLFFAFLTIFFLSDMNAQELSGLWGVDEVQVGNRTMTPVAKWFRFLPDNKYETGNGWTKNGYGHYAYDESAGVYTPQNENGIKDEFGSFQLTFNNGNMIWERQEEGMDVMVTLSPISEIPMAPADQVHGLWDLKKVQKDDIDISLEIDPGGKQIIFIRPDKLFRFTHGDGSQSNGYWWMNGHRPEFVLINFDKSIEDLRYEVSFKDNQLIMKELSGEGRIFTYQRVQEFPE